MRVTYEPDTGSAYLYLTGEIGPGGAKKTVSLYREHGINLDFDAAETSHWDRDIGTGETASSISRDLNFASGSGLELGTPSKGTALRPTGAGRLCNNKYSLCSVSVVE